MKTTSRALPKIASRAEWRVAREKFLAKEKAATRARDALNGERRRLPMVRIEKKYVFDGPNGKAHLLDLFEGRRQLILYHFMYHEHEDRFCEGCSFFADQVCHLAHLYARDTSFALVARAPLAKIKMFKNRMGWTLPWFSSFGSRFQIASSASPRTKVRRAACHSHLPHGDDF